MSTYIAQDTRPLSCSEMLAQAAEDGRADAEFDETQAHEDRLDDYTPAGDLPVRRRWPARRDAVLADAAEFVGADSVKRLFSRRRPEGSCADVGMCGPWAVSGLSPAGWIICVGGRLRGRVSSDASAISKIAMTPSSATQVRSALRNAPAHRGRAVAQPKRPLTQTPVRVCYRCKKLDLAAACDRCISKAYELHCDSHPVGQIAEVMGISEDRACYLLDVAQDRRDLAALQMDRVPTAGLRVLLKAAGCEPLQKAVPRPEPVEIAAGRIPERELKMLAAILRRRSPTCTRIVARAAGYRSPSTITRKLGVIERPAGDVKGRQYSAYYNETVDVDDAGRIVRALGLAPCDVPWL